MKFPRCRRRGYTLVFFAMFLFGFMALAALVIDLGFARLTQRQMQTAADSAALEGLRGEGLIGYGDRREAARAFVGWHFDDNLHGDDVDDGAFDTGTGQVGAGPLIGFSGGVGDPSLAAGQYMEVDPANPVHKPEALNGTPPTNGRFQVALRRGAADLPSEDLYTDGPPLPYLFARGSLIDRSLIVNGITVRATARATNRRVLSVGMPDDDASPPLPGLAPFTLELGYWNGLVTGTADRQPITMREIGEVGRFFKDFDVDAQRSKSSEAAPPPVSIGRVLPAVSPVAVSPVPDGVYSGYVPIYAAISGEMETVDRVVGFGRAIAVVTTDTSQQVEITRAEEAVATENASAVICYPLTVSSSELNEVLLANKNILEPLRAPVLERADR